MYIQIWIWVIAQCLISSNWIVGLAGIIPWTLLYFIRVPKEEKMMAREFKAQYLEYAKQTGKIFPRLGSRS